MLNLMKNTFKVLFRKKSMLASIIITPAILTVCFSYFLGSQVYYSVGIINEDNGIVSKEILNAIEETGTVRFVELNEKEVDTSLVGREIELSIKIEDNFSEDLINGEVKAINIKSINDSEIKSSVESVINSEIDSLYKLSVLANNNEDKFNELLEEYRNSEIEYNLNEENPKNINVGASIGMVITVIFMSSFFITRYIIDDEREGTKDRILMANVSKLNYYTATLLVFFICSSITSIVYFIICNILGFDFGTQNPEYYLIVLFTINFLAIAFNLAIVTISKTPSVAATMNSLLVVIMSMLSGLFWPFYIMPETIQKIGSLIPTRWAYICFEKIQQGAIIKDILPELVSVILVGIGLIIITVIFSNKKKSIRQ